MIPDTVVADVFLEERFDVRELLVPDGKVPDEPLPVGPDVVIFAILFEHEAEEGELVGGDGGDWGHDYLAVVPVEGKSGLLGSEVGRLEGMDIDEPYLVIF